MAMRFVLDSGLRDGHGNLIRTHEATTARQQRETSGASTCEVWEATQNTMHKRFTCKTLEEAKSFLEATFGDVEYAQERAFNEACNPVFVAWHTRTRDGIIEMR